MGMGIGSAIAIWFIIWWLIFYPVLTLGNRAPDKGSDAVSGADRGAPARPRMWRRVALTTVLSFVVFGAFLALLASGITLDDIPLPSPPGMSGAGQ